MSSENNAFVALATASDRIGHDGRLPEDASTADLVRAVLARPTPAGVYLTPAGRWALPGDHPAHRHLHRPGWDWGMDAHPVGEAATPTPQSLRTCPQYWIHGPGHDAASRTPCGHGEYRLTNSCPDCEDANEAPADTDPDAMTGPLLLAALAQVDLPVKPSTEGDCLFVDLGQVWIEITDTISEAWDYPLGQHRGFCAQVVHRDDPSRYHLCYASADHDARRDVPHLVRAVAAEADHRRRLG
ncbi:hypothetical protein ABZ234_08605 [Nocardiopsis sp. NPDC006198]|uniref:hypothetical protein n=1 Tax=Nocardiopsis sp. NPDC006198 TaxID=3154472 RepID=UPI0033B9E0EF